MIYLKWFVYTASLVFVVTVLNVIIYEHKTRKEIKKGRKR
jgi:hypothetical protein